MYFLFQSVPNLLLFVAFVVADFSGRSYPPPTDLTSNQSHVAMGWQNVTSTLEAYLQNQTTSSSAAAAALKNVTFSVGIFSLHDLDATKKMQFHYTSPEVANAVNGTHKVDGNSIYHVASVSKLFTVFAALLELNDTDWDRPVTDIVPSLAEFAQQHLGSNPINTVEWAKVTPSALAAQIAGLPRDPGVEGDLLTQYLAAKASGTPGRDPTTLGFPPIDNNDPIAFPQCDTVGSSDCYEDLFIETVENRPPTFLPWTTPAYADNGFALLGLAISNLTGKKIEEVHRESVFDPLGLSSTNTLSPPESEWYRSVIPGGLSFFLYPPDVFIASGGVSSTTNDLAKFGLGILNSTLLPPDQTRKWMKPVSFTDRLDYAVGRPWEIMRYVHSSGHITDIYPKSGNSGLYSSWMVLLPDYDAGFSILSAGTSALRSEAADIIADVITNAILPALQAQAGIEAGQKFAGTYTSTVQGLNSSLTVIYNQTATSAPGLVISSWISNGTDMLKVLGPADKLTPARLLPTIVDMESGQQAFRLVGSWEGPGERVPGQLFSGVGFSESDWTAVDELTYGGVAVGLMIFDVCANGSATAVTPLALRTTLKRTS